MKKIYGEFGKYSEYPWTPRFDYDDFGRGQIIQCEQETMDNNAKHDIWINIYGSEIKISTLDLKYLENIIRFIKVKGYKVPRAFYKRLGEVKND